MRLLRAHIAGFGNLRDYEISFDRSFTSILEGNGYGKSTLAAFIKAMLYGLESARANGKKTSERTRFAPLGGGSFGGLLVVSYKGESLTIERTFDRKSSTLDAFKVINEKGHAVSDLDGVPFAPETFGKLVVGLEKESFERTCFAYSSSLAFESNGDIKRKLQGIYFDEDRDHTYEEALSQMEGDLKKHRQGASDYGKSIADRISQGEERLRDIKKELRALSSLKGELAADDKGREAIVMEIAGLEKRIELVKGEETRRKNQETLDGMVSNLDRDKEALVALMLPYPKGFPKEGVLERLKEASDDEAIALNDLKRYSLSEEEAEALASLREKYGPSGPSAELLERLESGESELAAKRKAAAEGSDAESALRAAESELPYLASLSDEKLHNLSGELGYYLKTVKDLGPRDSKLVSKKPDEGTVDYAETLVSSLNLKRQALLELEGKKPRLNALTVLLIVLTLGVYLIAFKRKERAFMEEKRILNGEIASLSAELTKLFSRYDIEGGDFDRSLIALKDLYKQEDPGARKEEEALARLSAILSELSLSSDDVIETAEKLVSEIGGLCDLRAKRAFYIEIKRKSDVAASSLEASLAKEIASFDSHDLPLSEKIASFQRDLSSFKLLVDKERAARNAGETLGSLRTKSAELLAPYGIALREGSVAKTHIAVMGASKEASSLRGNIERREAEIKDFQARNALPDASSPLPSEDLPTLQSRLERSRADLHSREFEIAQKEDRVARIDDLEEEAEELQGKLEALKKEREVVAKSKEILEKAYAAFEEKYIGPTKTAFISYLNRIEPRLAANAKMDSDYLVVREERGETVGSDHLSDGEKTALLLALRFAVLDGLFPDADCVLVLDDPFVFLDEKNVASVGKILKGIAGENRQIVYLTCHPSRSI